MVVISNQTESNDNTTTLSIDTVRMSGIASRSYQRFLLEIHQRLRYLDLTNCFFIADKTT